VAQVELTLMLLQKVLEELTLFLQQLHLLLAVEVLPLRVTLPIQIKMVVLVVVEVLNADLEQVLPFKEEMAAQALGHILTLPAVAEVEPVG
jgi:hypothetical protein